MNNLLQDSHVLIKIYPPYENSSPEMILWSFRIYLSFYSPLPFPLISFSFPFLVFQSEFSRRSNVYRLCLRSFIPFIMHLTEKQFQASVSFFLSLSVCCQAKYFWMYFLFLTKCDHRWNRSPVLFFDFAQTAPCASNAACSVFFWSSLIISPHISHSLISLAVIIITLWYQCSFIPQFHDMLSHLFVMFLAKVVKYWLLDNQ